MGQAASLSVMTGCQPVIRHCALIFLGFIG